MPGAARSMSGRAAQTMTNPLNRATFVAYSVVWKATSTPLAVATIAA